MQAFLSERLSTHITLQATLDYLNNYRTLSAIKKLVIVTYFELNQYGLVKV